MDDSEVRRLWDIPHTEHVFDSRGRYFKLGILTRSLFRVNLNIIDRFQFLVVPKYAEYRKFRWEDVVDSELKDYYNAENPDYIKLYPFAKSIIESVQDITVDAETGEVLNSASGRVFLDDDGVLRICLSSGGCIIPFSDTSSYVGGLSESILEQIQAEHMPIVKSASVYVVPDFNEDLFREIVRERFVPILNKKIINDAYENLVDSLSERYGFDCKDEGEFTVCKYESDAYYINSDDGKTPVRRVIEIKIRNPFHSE